MTDAADGETPRPGGVLVVEDEAALRGIMERTLRLAGYRVWSADNGASALDVYREHAAEIDAVVSDVRMPRLDGPGMLAALRVVNPGVRLVFVTGHAGGHTVDELLAAGAEAVVAKPFRVEELVRTVHDVIRGR